MNADAVVTQLKLDIAQLPPAYSIQAAQHVYKQMASLQHQLITVGAIHAYAEDELVSLLKGKMVGTSFTNFKFILRSKEKITTVPTLRLDPLAFTAPVPDRRISWQELGQSIQMAVEEDISSQNSSTTSSMLTSQGDEVATALASQMLPFHGRQQQRPSNQSRLPIRSMHANPTNQRQYSSDRQSTPAGGYRRPEQAYNAAPARFQPRGYPPTQAQFPPLPPQHRQPPPPSTPWQPPTVRRWGPLQQPQPNTQQRGRYAYTATAEEISPGESCAFAAEAYDQRLDYYGDSGIPTEGYMSLAAQAADEPYGLEIGQAFAAQEGAYDAGYDFVEFPSYTNRSDGVKLFHSSQL